MVDSVHAGSGARGGLSRRPVTLDQLIALNDEIAALARSGMPLERGLLNLGSDLPGRLGAIATLLGQRMSGGMSLTGALDASGSEIPPVYRAVVEAGVKSGRLSIALEGLATFARGFAEARRSIGLALWYPMTVVVLAYALFIFVITTVIPRFLSASEYLKVPVHGAVVLLNRAGETAWYWAPWPPALFLLLVVAWGASRLASSLGGRRHFGLLRWFPWMGSMIASFEAASFAEILALLVDHQMPFPEALVLAGEASGDAGLSRSSHALAEAVKQGLPTAEVLKHGTAYPPLLRWVLATGPQQRDLSPVLKEMAVRYRSKARRQAEKIRVVLPTVLLLGIGVSATLLYAVALFVPITSLWTGLQGESF